MKILPVDVIYIYICPMLIAWLLCCKVCNCLNSPTIVLIPGTFSVNLQIEK